MQVAEAADPDTRTAAECSKAAGRAEAKEAAVAVRDAASLFDALRAGRIRRRTLAYGLRAKGLVEAEANSVARTAHAGLVVVGLMRVRADRAIGMKGWMRAMAAEAGCGQTTRMVPVDPEDQVVSAEAANLGLEGHLEVKVKVSILGRASG